MGSFHIIQVIFYACASVQAFSDVDTLPFSTKRSTSALNLHSLFNPFQSNGDIPRLEPELDNSAISPRRKFLILASTIATTTPANAIDNPLNLKGTFWETGEIYQKPKTPQPTDESDFLSILENTITALHSPTLLNTITQGKYGQTSRLLRGNLISESKIRIAANALIDLLPEDDEAIYKSYESFRVFLRYLDVLDAEVEGASRSLFGDPRLKILERLGEVEDALKVFLREVRVGLEAQ